MMFDEKTDPQNDDFVSAARGASACPAPVTPLEFEGQAVRMSVDEFGNPWWVARDVCEILGIRNTHASVVRGLGEDEKKLFSIPTAGGPQTVTVVNEPGLYFMLLRSRKPAAKKLQRWFMREVLPAVLNRWVMFQREQDPLVSLLEGMRDRRLNELKLFRQQEALARRIEAVEQKAEGALALAQSNHCHYSVLDWARLCGVEMDLPTASRVGKTLTGICERRGLSTGRVRDPRFGSVRTYPESVLRDYFGDILDGEANL